MQPAVHTTVTLKSRESHRILIRIERLEPRQLLSAAPGNSARELSVMTQNLYLGADLKPAIVAAASGDPSLIIAADSAVFAAVAATDFPSRAAAIAKEVKATEPDLIGLDEAALWEVSSAAYPATADTPVYDFVQILVDQLAARGLHYAPVAVSDNAKVEGPAFTSATDPTLRDIRLTDRDTLLARTDLPASAFKLSDVETHQFQNFFTPVPGIDVHHGWIQADVKVRGKSLRLISTHLEADAMPIRDLQTQEILAGPANTTLPTLLVGDFNSDANSTVTNPLAPDNVLTYQLLTATAGFTDTWSDLHPNSHGNTWGDNPPLTNPTATFTERIDFALTRHGLTGDSASLVGNHLSDRTPTGLWPSDHAGLVATLTLDKQTGPAKKAATPFSNTLIPTDPTPHKLKPPHKLRLRT